MKLSQGQRVRTKMGGCPHRKNIGVSVRKVIWFAENYALVSVNISEAVQVYFSGVYNSDFFINTAECQEVVIASGRLLVFGYSVLGEDEVEFKPDFIPL